MFSQLHSIWVHNTTSSVHTLLYLSVCNTQRSTVYSEARERDMVSAGEITEHLYSSMITVYIDYSYLAIDV